MRVALVHEFLIQQGGAEKVLEAFHELFPEAPVYTLFYDRNRTGGRYDGWDVRSSFLQKIPGALAHYKWFLPLMGWAMERFDLSGYDVVLSDSSAFAMGALKPQKAVHICYCHTPTRYIWENHDDYIENLPYPKFLKILAHIYIKNHQTKWDLRAALRPDWFIANSRTVQERIKKYYARDSTVIYPPVDTEFFRPHPNPLLAKKREKGAYFLTGSRLEPYKKIDLVVQAFRKLKLPLKVIGTGTQLQELKVKSKQSKNIEFLGRVTDTNLQKLYAQAQAFVFPALEDAGIMVLESLACGTPVIGLNKGGTAEFVRDRENGALFANQNVQDIVAAVNRFQTMEFNSEKIRTTVLQFGKEEFKRKIFEFITRVITSPQPSPIPEREENPLFISPSRGGEN